MNKHSFTFEQYCNVVDKNIILEETTFHNGSKKLRCLNVHKCNSTMGGCRNNFILRRMEKSVEKGTEE